MWCNQIFSLIKKETIVSISEEEFQAQVQAYMTENEVSQEDAENAVFDGLDKTEKQTIANICVCDNYEVANQIARMTYGQDAIAIETTLIPVQIGDTYSGGVFYRDGKIIEPNPTEEQRVTTLENQTTLHSDLQVESELDIDYRVSLLELGLV